MSSSTNCTAVDIHIADAVRMVQSSSYCIEVVDKLVVCLNSAISVVGIVGNVLTIHMLHKHLQRNTTNAMLKYLSAAYCLLLSSSFTKEMLFYFKHQHFVCSSYWLCQAEKWMYIAWIAAQIMVIWVITVICVFRCVSLRWLHLATVVWDKYTVYGTLVVISIGSVLLTVPYMISYKFTEDVNRGAFVACMDQTIGYKIYRLVLMSGLVALLPIGIMIVAAVSMVRNFIATHDRNIDASLAEQHRHEYQVLRLMLGIIVSFLVCYWTFAVNGVYELVLYVAARQGRLETRAMENFRAKCHGYIFYQVSFTAINVNAGVYFFLHLSLVTKFKNAVRNMCKIRF